MTDKIRVLHVFKSSLNTTNGGIEVFIDSLCRHSSRLGVKHTLLALSKNPSVNPIERNGYTIIEAKLNFSVASTGISFEIFRLFSRLSREHDIIHYHFPNPLADLLHFICRPNKPFVITYHSDIVRQKILKWIYFPLMRLFLNKADIVIATSPNYLKSSVALRDLKKPARVIPIGIEKSDYPEPTNDLLEYWKAKLPKKFFLFVGVMRYYKGLHVALEAVRDTEHQLVLAGVGEVERELRAYVRTHKMTNVQFLGKVSEVEKVALIKLCFGYIFPSHLRSEAFGISLLEGAAFGRPLISCEIGSGTSFINLHNDTGLVIEPGSSAKLLEALNHLAADEELAEQYGTRAQIRHNECFTGTIHAENYFKVYKEVF